MGELFQFSLSQFPLNKPKVMDQTRNTYVNERESTWTIISPTSIIIPTCYTILTYFQDGMMAAHKGKHIFGIVRVGEKGQIVIPKEARDIFDIKPGDSLLVMGDEAQGIALAKSELFMQFAEDIFNAREIVEDEE